MDHAVRRRRWHASRSQLILAKMATAIAEVCAAFDLVVVEKRTETVHMRSPRAKVDVVEVEAVGQSYEHVESFVRLGRKMSVIDNIIPEVKWHTGQAWRCPEGIRTE